MMRAQRVLLVAALAFGSITSSHVAGQAQMPAAGAAEQFSAIRLVENPDFRRFVDVARDCIKGKDWSDAATALQLILDNEEDFYVRVKEANAAGEEITRWASVKYEANSLLSSMPAEGLAMYELRFGGKAAQMLQEAKSTGDWELLAKVAGRFLHTDAGKEANDLLATYFLDRGQYFMAALRYDRMLAALGPPFSSTKGDSSTVTELTLFKSALAYRRAGDTAKADLAWRHLEPRLRSAGGMRVNGDMVDTARLEKLLQETPVSFANYARDWPLVRGNHENSAQAAGSPPLLDIILWQRPTVLDVDWNNQVEPHGKEADDWIKQAIATTRRHDPNAPIMPGTFPIIAGNLAVYRSYVDVRAVHLREERNAAGEVVAKPGDIAWKGIEFDGALAHILDQAKYRTVLDNGGNGWLNIFNNQLGAVSFVYDNSLLGAISTDRNMVYAIDDLAVPAPNTYLQQFMFNRSQGFAIQPLIMQNSLHAYHLKNGKLIWRLGDALPKEEDKTRDSEREKDLRNSHFLGAPLPIGGKLYVLNEKANDINGDAELRLLCIDPNRKNADNRSVGEIVFRQNLGTVDQQNRFTHDVNRRTNAVHLAYGEGILVCPTNAGQVIGVDLMSRSLAWAYPYREKTTTAQPIAQPFRGVPVQNVYEPPTWRSAPPVIQEGRVVFTAPDASSIHCINLRDGTRIWSKGHVDGDLFFAGVYKGKVLIVGKNSCRALRLADGLSLWNIATGDVPSGQGVACKDIYYLPLGKGEICAIDIERGVIKARNRASRSRISPGNLVFHEETGTVVSLTPNSIVAYPQLTARLELATKAVTEEPNNPEQLFVLGELRLADGQVHKAVADLRGALALKPEGELRDKCKSRLYDAYTDLFQVDFAKAARLYLNDYRALCKVEGNAEAEQQRLARYFRTIGEGRQAEGDLVAAFQMYRQFGALPINQEGVAGLDDPSHKIPISVWLRGRVGAMIASASARQREPLERNIAEEWKEVQLKNDVNAIRSFVDMFDVGFKVGREARLELARAIMDKKDRSAFLEAELNLQQLRVGKLREEAQTGGRALAELARLEERKGAAHSMRLAADYYEELKERFAAAEVRPGKTGADLYDELASDKRFLPYLGGSAPLWNNANIAARDIPATANRVDPAAYVFQPRGDLNPLMKTHRLVIDPSNPNLPQLRLVDLTTNQTRWTTPLSSNPMNFQLIQYLYQQSQNNTVYYPNARFRFYEVKGHLAAFQMGTMVHCLDLDTPRPLWQFNLLDGSNQPSVNLQPNVVLQQVIPDQEGNLEIVLWNQLNGQRTRTRIGYVAAVQASYVALLSQKGLVVVDPLRGNRLWSKLDVPAHAEVFGDEQYIYIIGSGGAGAGQVLRASDGAPVQAPDFSAHYQNRLRTVGGNILAASPGNELTLRSYDIVTGKDVWSRRFTAGSVNLNSEDPAFAGVIDREGKLVVLDSGTGAEVLATSVVQGRVARADLQNLRNPLLLHDRDHFYVALNQDIDQGRVSGGIIGNNFANGLRCAVVNGWFMAFHKDAGKRKSGAEWREYKLGDLAWHSYAPITNQMVVLEQFDMLPVIIFTSRYNELVRAGAGGSRWVTHTQSISKRSGKMILAPEAPQPWNNAAQFHAFTVDAKVGAINMTGVSNTVQHYIDDGRAPDAAALGNGQTRVGGTPYDPAVAPLAPLPLKRLPLNR